MNRLAYALVWVLETTWRWFPVPCRPGLRAVGAPGAEAPVLLTGNYHLTVSRLQKALQGLDCWLLVADSGGINVWCAAAGGRLTDHRVIAALKTSGIEHKVSHRQVVLPQLAAAGIRPRRIEARSGWRCLWGPVRAEDIPEFLRGQGSPHAGLREVRFSWKDRVEMALAWAFPMGLVTALLLLLLYPAGILSFLVLVAAVPLLVFLALPLYAGPWLGAAGRRPARKRPLPPAGIWGLLAALAACVVLLLPHPGRRPLLLHAAFALLLVLVLAADLRGSTPLVGGGFLAERNCRVVWRRTRCRGVYDCLRVCPRGCFSARGGGVELRRPERCLRCGACIVQCPNDALRFHDASGRPIDPRLVRERKLSLSGRRTAGGR